jgi:hypothetical protein
VTDTIAAERAEVAALIRSHSLTRGQLTRYYDANSAELEVEKQAVATLLKDEVVIEGEIASDRVGMIDVDPTRLAKVSAANAKLLEMLTEYYCPPLVCRGWGASKSHIHNFFAMDPTSPAGTPSVAYLAEKMARAVVWKEQFIVGAIGSSVTVGHDNCAYDSYENQLQRTMSSVWRAAGVKWEVRNAGQGASCGDSYKNQIFCTRQLVGDDIDAIHYSWTYYEKFGSVVTKHEEFIRFALSMKRAPAPLFINMYGEKGTCKSTIDRAANGLLPQYAKYGVNGVCLKAGLVEGTWPFRREARTTTRYGEDAIPPPLSADATPTAIVARRKSLGVAFRNWHPGPLGFEGLSDSIAFLYATALALALKNIDAEIAKGGAAGVALRWPRKHPASPLSSKLPSPLYCDPKICSLPHPPSCMNVELPTFGQHQIFSLPMANAMNPYRDAHYNINAKGWKLQVDEVGEAQTPAEERGIAACAHADRCAAWKSIGTESGWITFRLPRMDRGRIIVCAPVMSSDQLHEAQTGVTFLDAGTQFFFNDVLLHPTKKDLVYGKCLEVMSKFTKKVNGACDGHCHLGVVSPLPVSISHIIAQ